MRRRTMSSCISLEVHLCIAAMIFNVFIYIYDVDGQFSEVDWNWAQWMSWTPCSKTCGFGFCNRNRICTDPAPGGGSRECPRFTIRENYCQEEPCMALLECRINGGWTEWSAFSNCSEFCGGGIMRRNRSCTNPKPQFGGFKCERIATEDMSCNTVDCGVNRVWGEWTLWSTQCSKTCGDGAVHRDRVCDGPAPTYGGEYCDGRANQTKKCVIQPCIDGSWTYWSPWSICSQSCLGGVQARSRSCINPRSVPPGQDCPASDRVSQWQICNQQPCPVHGGWNLWSEWTECPVTCGGSLKTRVRNCSNPVPMWDGRKCNGQNIQKRGCNTVLCPVFATTENITYRAGVSDIHVMWTAPLDYEEPILYYTLHIRPRPSRAAIAGSILHLPSEGYHYVMYNLSSFKKYPTKNNETYSMVISLLQPFTKYQLCMTTKFNHTKESHHSSLTDVETHIYPFPAPPILVTTQLADYSIEREYKVLVRWYLDDSVIYSKPTRFSIMMRDIMRPGNKDWIMLASVTIEIRGFLVRSSMEISLPDRAYVVQVSAFNELGHSKPTVCSDVVDYQAVGSEVLKEVLSLDSGKADSG